MLPSWKDPELGSMKRVALWLVELVGEGQLFTKEQLRQAFPGVSQVDRRMRDLRDFGWRIDTNREDPSLDAHEQRFVQAGIPVWEPGKATRPSTVVSASRRREVYAADGHLCRSCGISTGETYVGTFETAQLDIARREVLKLDGSTAVELVTECKRCRVGGRNQVADLAGLIRDTEALSPQERKKLTGWVEADERTFGPAERLWSSYRTLPEESRAALRATLGLR
ncbi:hypothetical protein [Amycolatopsis sp. YIM 10]|uniref:hypothetical protein n=1 Tax=Amycolatopsis sp. YIM 10 TaxID=2653857 RepID=UPI0012A86E02|nr:hypothetical protein [Amycolatopsis sp. YIM 10]QFU85533.1 hypothetical protein YIM_01515 [Amycolatopsis sp. YIM 10]